MKTRKMNSKNIRNEKNPIALIVLAETLNQPIILVLPGYFPVGRFFHPFLSPYENIQLGY
ncbi:MAG TPA: hypothetical protein VFO37_13730 [Chitinophagaceae bacterium]|nr:hypothetical protein [Chitinophagaceae bacterium]